MNKTLETIGLAALTLGLSGTPTNANADVYVNAPFTRVRVGQGIHVRAPFVNIDIGPRQIAPFRPRIYVQPQIYVPNPENHHHHDLDNHGYHR